MFVQTEETPNPNSIKFILDQQVTKYSSFDFDYQTDTDKHSDFAKSVFRIGNVERIFILDDFITITKLAEGDWSIIKPQVLSVIMDFVASKKPIVNPQNNEVRTFDDPIEKEIYEIIEDRVKPAVAMDGGDIEFIKFDKESGVVYVSMHGSCSGCPSSTVTLKEGVVRTLQHYIPEVKDVEQI
jgi:NFU1 iron-sulfur cluster scaffold homolog, mitochondrial